MGGEKREKGVWHEEQGGFELVKIKICQQSQKFVHIYIHTNIHVHVVQCNLCTVDTIGTQLTVLIQGWGVHIEGFHCIHLFLIHNVPLCAGIVKGWF